MPGDYARPYYRAAIFLRGHVALLKWKYDLHVIIVSKAKRSDRPLIQLIAIVQGIRTNDASLSAYGWKVLRET